MRVERGRLHLAAASAVLATSPARAAAQGSVPTARGPAVRSVHYTDPLTIDTFWRDIYQPGEPVLIKGLLDGTPIMEHFSLEGMRSGLFSHYRHDVTFRAGHGQGPRNPHGHMQNGWLFRDVETWLTNQRGAKEGGPVLGASIMQQPTSHHDVLRTWLDSLPSSLWLPAHTVQPSLWVNFNSTPLASGLHFDPMDNFFMCVEGSKAFQVYPYGQGDNIEPDPNFMSYSRSLYPIYALSGLDAAGLRREVLEPDLDHFPGFAEAKGTLVELEPGDVFYLPSGYWHGGIHDALTVGVSFWWTVLSPHERVFEMWMRRTPQDDDEADWDEWPLDPGFEDVQWPDEPPEPRKMQRFYRDTGESIDFDFLEHQRKAAGCFRSHVGSFEEFEEKLAAIGGEVSCMRDWYERSWGKLQTLAEKPPPKSRKALDNQVKKLESGSNSLWKACGQIGDDRNNGEWSYSALLQTAFPGCEMPEGCDDILRRARAAVRSVVQWERCPDRDEL